MNDQLLFSLRLQIDELDAQLLQVVAQRMELVKKVGQYKKENNLPALDQQRWQQVVESRVELGRKLGLEKSLVTSLYESLHIAALAAERNL